ncbi:glutathione S-transferase-like [Amblyomma americanum]
MPRRPVLGYWSVRGLGQYIRNLLVYKGVAFEDKLYRFGPAPDFDRSHWQGEKFSLGLQFPNLPYYIDGDVKVTQSLAILRYLARKHDLAARNEQETLQMDLLEQQAKDLALGLTMTALNPTFDEARKKYQDNLVTVLKPWADHMRDRKWALGDRLTYVDFLLYEALDWNHEFNPEAFSSYPALLEYLKRFEELPNIKEYFASESYSKWPILGPMVKWGHFKE